MEVEKKLRIFETHVGREIVKVEKITSGLGVFVWDPMRRIGASAHVFSATPMGGLSGSDNVKNIFDIPSTIRNMFTKLGIDSAGVARTRIKFAGGADLPGLKIGRKLVARLITFIRSAELQVGGYDVGGNVVRTASFNPITGKVIVEYSTGGVKVI